MARSAVLLAWLLLGGPWSRGQDVETLVRQLGDESWAVREDASRELLRRAPEAWPRLVIAVGDLDPEISRRASMLLQAMEPLAVEEVLRLVLAHPAERTLALSVEPTDLGEYLLLVWAASRREVRIGSALVASLGTFREHEDPVVVIRVDRADLTALLAPRDVLEEPAWARELLGPVAETAETGDAERAAVLLAWFESRRRR